MLPAGLRVLAARMQGAGQPLGCRVLPTGVQSAAHWGAGCCLLGCRVLPTGVQGGGRREAGREIWGLKFKNNDLRDTDILSGR